MKLSYLKLKLWVYARYFFWNLPYQFFHRVYWFPVTFKGWLNKDTCLDCNSRLDIFGHCEGLKNLRLK